MSLVPLGLFILRCIAWLPRPAGRLVGRGLGLILFTLARSRRHITDTNLRVCFPELSTAARRELTRQCFIENGIGLVETAWAWYRRRDDVLPEVRYTGEHHLTDRSPGQGVLLICPHYSMLDLAAPIVHQIIGRFAATYRPNDNPIFDHAVIEGRSRYMHLINVRSLRDTVRALKSGNVVWLGPDQDMGPKGSVFAPFFGRMACTVTTPTRLLQLTGARPVYLTVRRVEGLYEATFARFPDTYPSDDLLADATLLNATIEAAIRVTPAQYMWMHKRFKTNPDLTRQTLYQDH